MIILAAIALGLWLALLLVPWQPWRCREHLEAEGVPLASASDLTVLIPARNEAAVIGETLRTLSIATPGATVLVIDDESQDGTAAAARASGLVNLALIVGTPPPPGWAGKLWALEQGLERVKTPRMLLLDADIRIAPGMVAALVRKAEEGYALVSVLAEPCFRGFWGLLLLPAFVYFFKLIYPFALVNRAGGSVAAAAGGVMLVEREALVRIGGFSAWRNEIIDDCALARRMKRGGFRCFLGLTHGAHSLRRQGLGSITAMVARSAYVQLRESPPMLAGITALMALCFWVPPAALAWGGASRWFGLGAWLALAASYVPTLRYYRLNPLSAVFMPFTATLYLAMTWYSAIRSHLGTRSAWKGRRYMR